MEHQVSVQRVVNRYLTKVAKEKSVNQLIDEKFKTWKGKNPNTGDEVGYWTVKGWKQITKKQISKDSKKSKLKEYASEVFKEFSKAVKGDDKEVQKTIEGMISKPNLGLPEKVFKGNKLALEVEKPSRQDVKDLAESLRDSFKTPGFNRGAIKQNLQVFGTDEWIKRSAMMVAKPLRAIGAKLSKDDDFKEAVREAQESNPEVAGAAKNLSANWTQSTIAPLVISSLTGTSGVSIGAGVKGLVTAGLSSVGVGVTSEKLWCEITNSSPGPPLISSCIFGLPSSSSVQWSAGPVTPDFKFDFQCCQCKPKTKTKPKTKAN